MVKRNNCYMKIMREDESKYSVGSIHYSGRNIRPWSSGFWYREALEETLLYEKDAEFICEIMVLGDIVATQNNDLFTNKIKIVRHIPYDEYRTYLKDNADRILKCGSSGVLNNMARHAVALERLSHSRDVYTRRYVASHKYNLEKLMYDSSPLVRAEVARQRFGLDVLCKDNAWQVRREVAKQGYRPEVFVDDLSHRVRKELIYRGYELEYFAENDASKFNRYLALSIIRNEKQKV